MRRQLQPEKKAPKVKAARVVRVARSAAGSPSRMRRSKPAPDVRCHRRRI